MASVNHPGKRRRVENASSVLSKPFKSPLRRPTQASEDKKNESLITKQEVKAEKDSPGDQNTAVNEKGDTETSTPAASASRTASNAIPQTHKRKLATTPTRTQPKPADPVIADLQSQQKALQARIAALRSELDTAQQARRIESSDRDAELERLIAKWRSVSQSAADEVFEGAQERFTRMGGMAAWKERTKSQNERWQQEEMESWYGNVETEGVEVDANEGELALKREELLDELGNSAKEEDEAKRDEKEDEENEEFTMDMMLKTLNIDPRLIGFDVSEQRWSQG